MRTFSRMRGTVVLACACTVAAALVAWADTKPRSVQVIVRDANGSPLPGAELVLREDRGVKEVILTNQRGIAELSVSGDKVAASVSADNVGVGEIAVALDGEGTLNVTLTREGATAVFVPQTAGDARRLSDSQITPSGVAVAKAAERPGTLRAALPIETKIAEPGIPDEGGVAGGPPGNDDCGNAVGPLAVPSSTSGSTLGANLDVPPAPATCGTAITIGGVWYTVQGTGNTITATTCNDVSEYDTKISVFCGDCTNLTCVGGNDDGGDETCDCPNCGGSNYESRIAWCSDADLTYLVLVHGFGAGQGNFQLDLTDNGIPCTATTCQPAQQICTQPAGNCQAFNTVNANTSNVVNFTSADDFTPQSAGSINSICWWGAYLPGQGPDSFRVNYYEQGAFSLPGTLIASFQQGVNLTVAGPVNTGQLVAGIAPIYEYTGTHAAVPVAAGQCYWIEITNDATVVGNTWFWEWSDQGNGRSSQNNAAVFNDLAFCLNIGLGDASACLPPPPANDDCGNAEAIVGEVTVPYDNSAATTDGGPDGLCFAAGTDQIDQDIWYCWTSSCDARVRIETCGLSTFDTRIAVYAGCACPTGAAIACNDDACGSLQTRVDLDVVDGGVYLIRVGSYPGSLSGGGSFSITCVEPFVPICLQPAANCQAFNTVNANTSNVVNFTSADDFTPQSSGSVTDICWWGAYLPAVAVTDSFRVNYYDQGAGNLPGALLASFQQGVNLTVNGPVDTGQLVAGIAPIYEFTGTHAAVPVTAGQCYWIEITNDQGVSGSTWFWEWSDQGNGRSSQNNASNPTDLAFCLNLTLGDATPCLPPPPSNEDCASATALEIPSSTPGDTSAANPTSVPTCSPLGPAAPDVWYSVTGTGNTITASLCDGGTGYDSAIEVYCGDCAGTLNCVVGLDDFCGLQTEVSWCSQATVTYYIRIHGFAGQSGGFNLVMSDNGTPCTANVQCLPSGACCLPNDTCVITTATGCASQNGDYAGDGEPCSQPGGSPITHSFDTNLAIPDGPGGSTSETRTVVDPRVIGDVNVGITLNHTWVGDVLVDITHVNSGTTVRVIERVGLAGGEACDLCCGCSFEDFNGIILDDEGTGGAIEDQCTPGLSSPPNYTPFAPLSAFDGLNGSSDWTISVCDGAGADVGTLFNWSITIDVGGAETCPLCAGDRGDVNCDGIINFFDIDPFLLGLFDLPAYQAAFCGGDICAIDINCDNLVTFFDIDPFIACLFEACPPCP